MKKKILLCVTGGIAVFKAAALTSKLVQAGNEVRVIMSNSAEKFVTPLTFQTLSRHHVYTDTFEESNPEVVEHIELADWADVVLIAPATANIIGKIANGVADDFISTTLLATRAPVFIAAAMNVHMYENTIVIENMEKLRRHGYHFIEPGEGYLACGYVAKGRMEEPERIIEVLERFFQQNKLLHGIKILITGGPTRERIDPVRFFTNPSTGKMAYALAEVAVQLGAEVTLVSGPVNLDIPVNVECIKIETAEEMYTEVVSRFSNVDVVIKTAAVADYRPIVTYDTKMKKQDGNLTIEMERTKDILKELGQRKEKQILVGFAAETEQVEKYAKQKLEKKNADMIVANNVGMQGAGFANDTNIVTLVHKSGEITALPKMSKSKVAEYILTEIANMLEKVE